MIEIGLSINKYSTNDIIRDRYTELEEKIQNDIQDKFGLCYKIIAKAKWKQKFGTRRYGKTYGRWNK